MKRAIVVFAILLLLATALAQQASGLELINPGFDEGAYFYSNHWWAPWYWYSFTEFIPPPDGTELTYYWLNAWVGPGGLPWDAANNGFPNGLPGWGSTSPYGWDPTIGALASEMDHSTTPWCDTSDGYDHPRMTGNQWIKQWPSCRRYAGVGQFLGLLEVGKTYEVSAYAINSSEVNPADMRILVDRNAGSNAHSATVISDPAPNHPRGRYWIWSSTGNNRIGNYDDLSSPDCTGAYALYDKVSVQFTAINPYATMFLLFDCRNLNDLETNDFGMNWDQASIREVHSPVTSIAAARTAPAGTPITLSNVVVSSIFTDHGIDNLTSNPCVFVQNSGGAGMMVFTGRPVNIGDPVNITGELINFNGSMAVKATDITPGTGSAAKPVAMNNLTSGGTSVGGKGLSSLGLLSRVYGRVMEAGYWQEPIYGDISYPYALIDDGSGVDSAAFPAVLNPGFEGFNSDAWGPATSWTGKQSLDVNTTGLRPWWLGCRDDVTGTNSILAAHSGRMYVGRAGGLGTAWEYQRVSGLTAGQPATLKVWAFAGGDANAKVRIGADPNGGISQLATTIVWSPSTNTGGQWQELSVNFTAGAITTIWLESKHVGAASINSAMTAFDDVRISVAALQKKGLKVILPMGYVVAPGEYLGVTGNLWTEAPTGETVTRLFIPKSSLDILSY